MDPLMLKPGFAAAANQFIYRKNKDIKNLSLVYIYQCPACIIETTAKFQTMFDEVNQVSLQTFVLCKSCGIINKRISQLQYA